MCVVWCGGGVCVCLESSNRREHCVPTVLPAEDHTVTSPQRRAAVGERGEGNGDGFCSDTSLCSIKEKKKRKLETKTMTHGLRETNWRGGWEERVAQWLQRADHGNGRATV